QKLVRNWVAEVARRCGGRDGGDGSTCGAVTGLSLVVGVNQAVAEARGDSTQANRGASLGRDCGRRRRSRDAGRGRHACAVTGRCEDEKRESDRDERGQREGGARSGFDSAAGWVGVLQGGHDLLLVGPRAAGRRGGSVSELGAGTVNSAG